MPTAHLGPCPEGTGPQLQGSVHRRTGQQDLGSSGHSLWRGGVWIKKSWRKGPLFWRQWEGRGRGRMGATGRGPGVLSMPTWLWSPLPLRVCGPAGTLLPDRLSRAEGQSGGAGWVPVGPAPEGDAQTGYGRRLVAGNGATGSKETDCARSFQPSASFLGVEGRGGPLTWPTWLGPPTPSGRERAVGAGEPGKGDPPPRSLRPRT